MEVRIILRYHLCSPRWSYRCRIPELCDTDICYEALRIIALLEDPHARVGTASDDFLPVCFEPLGNEADVLLCAVRVPEGYAHILGGKLTAINGMPIEEIVEKLTDYTPHQNEYWPLHKSTKRYNGSFSVLTQKAALHVIGVVDSDADSVEFAFETETGTIIRTTWIRCWNMFSL